METAKLQKLVHAYDLYDRKIKEIKARHKEELAEDEKMLQRIRSKLATVIHRNEGGMQSVKGRGGVTVYAREEDKYRVVDFDELSEWIAEDPAERLPLLTRSVTKEEVVMHRRQTGAVEEGGKLTGGSMPPGVGMFTLQEVRLNRSGK